ncbi:sensor histidine kinase [Clostridium sp. DJ247]|uniref:sensor histidine kinase n=1 Tax=Clostridium sp. DJ247 TaxID=2726188 RepID=UPI00162ABB69|nr:histidine kinase [Clostridium sp. DJ247]MBC2580452.1 histidine kinase [Clostridium sp. DJ247]
MKLRLLKDILIKHFNNITLRNKLIVSFSFLIILAVLFVGIMSAYFSRKYLIDSEEAYITQSMDQLNRALDSFFEIYMDRTNLVFMSDEMQKIMDTEVTTIGEAADVDKKIKLLCGYIENDNKYPEMKNSYYYGGNIKYRLYLDNNISDMFGGQTKPLSIVEKESWYKQFSSETRTFKWQSVETIDGVPYISLSRRLVHFQDSKIKGLLQVYIPVQRIEDVINLNIRNKLDTVFYMDHNYNSIVKVGSGSTYLNDLKKLKLSDGTNRVSINNKNFLVGRFKSSTTGWEILYLVPIEQITNKTKLLTFITTASAVIALILCVIIAYKVASIITKRIKILVTKANMIDEHNLKTNLTLQGNDELGQLDRRFDKMVGRINKLIQDKYESELIINKVKLELLQQQINPHLLYNTLAMVSYTAKKEGNYEIRSVSDNLSSFYKGILSKGKTICTFKEEVDMARTYVDLMRYVYSIDIDIIFDIDEAIYDLYTLKLLLQPVIENSIIHGIKPKKRGTLVVSAYIEDNIVEVLVSDDGMGMNKDIVDELSSLTSYKDVTKGYGVSNIIKRIKLFFDDDYGVKVKSVPGEGTNFIIRLPVIEKKDLDPLMKKNMLN